ncbi:MAG TPA: 1-deoxy-D-xylulose-5-phosphate synthase, partial [Desulfobacterales bacterium]|nr:1-deoxy-D-xylulose-5-phosphate synthase [Desulfobacterales bacterium]
MSDPKPQFSVCSEALSLQKKSLLDAINSPVDLKRLAVEQLPQLAQEIRQQIIGTVSTTGGHLAPNLG